MPHEDDPAHQAWLTTARTYEAASRLLERCLAAEGLSIAKFDALAAVAVLGVATQQAVADELVVSKAGLATMLSRLERDGLVERRPSPDDARARLVTLTPAGARALDVALERQTEVVARTAALLSPADQARLRAIMERLGGHVDAAG